MLTALEQLVGRSEGQYLNADVLDALVTHSLSFAARRQAYLAIKKHEDQLVRDVLGPADHSPADSTELTLMLRYCALAMLLADSDFLPTHYLPWFKERVQAWGRQTRAASGVLSLRKALGLRLNAATVGLIDPFLQTVHRAIQ